MRIMNIRFVLANVKSRIEEGPENVNVQARSRQKLGENRRGNLLTETVMEQRAARMNRELHSEAC